MTMLEQVKARVKVAMLAKDTFERDLMKVVLGDLQMQETREGKPLTEAQAEAVVRKMVKSGRETLEALQKRGDAAMVAHTQRELVALESLLPQTLGVSEIIAALEPVADQVRAAGNEGQATGVAMKFLKGQAAVVEGKDVAAAVQSIRTATL